MGLGRSDGSVYVPPSAAHEARQAPAAAATPARSTRRELARIPDSFIEQLKERADIVAVVGRHVALKKKGSVEVGLCPFHGEKTPSFTVSPSRNTFHCFGCGAHGNALGFLMEHDGLPFREAIKELARETGLPLPSEMVEGGKPAVDVAPLYDAMALANRFFRHSLAHTSAAKDYLRERGVTAETLKRFAIGYAPDEWQGLAEAFKDYRTNSSILDAGLVREKETPGRDGSPSLRRYDTFRGRITFGVRDARGRIVAFGARVLDNSEPKYLNSPETPIFDKSGALFGIYEARESIRAQKEAIAAEGYFDVAMMHQHGVTNAVASMGTAFTRWHLERLLAMTSRVVFCFDGDKAGRNAALRAMKICAGLIQDEHDFRFLVLPDNLDPDEFLRQRGKQAFDELKSAAPGFSEFLITQLQQEHDIQPGAASAASAEARARFAAEASEIVSQISYGAKLRKILLEQIAREARLPGSAVKDLRRQQELSRRNGPATVWTALLEAVALAPAVALAQREDILAQLDENDPQEAQLAQALRDLPEEHPADDESASGYLRARDVLHSALDLIVEQRKKQVREELERQRQAGELSETDYLIARQSLARAG